MNAARSAGLRSVSLKLRAHVLQRHSALLLSTSGAVIHPRSSIVLPPYLIGTVSRCRRVLEHFTKSPLLWLTSPPQPHGIVRHPPSTFNFLQRSVIPRSKLFASALALLYSTSAPLGSHTSRCECPIARFSSPPACVFGLGSRIPSSLPCVCGTSRCIIRTLGVLDLSVSVSRCPPKRCSSVTVQAVLSMASMSGYQAIYRFKSFLHLVSVGAMHYECVCELCSTLKHDWRLRYSAIVALEMCRSAHIRRRSLYCSFFAWNGVDRKH